MSVSALYPGTFDPPTNGHIDLIQRGAKLFDHLTVAILNNPVKDPLFTVEERVEMLKESTSTLSNVSVATFDGLMVEFARRQGASAVLRGIRAISDYEYEFQMALMNRRLAPEIETVFLQPAGRYSFVSSRMLKEVFSFGGDVSGLVPPNVLKRLRNRMGAEESIPEASAGKLGKDRAHPFPGALQVFRQNAAFGNRSHEVGIAGPAGQGVQMQVSGDARATGRTQIHAEVVAVRMVEPLQHHFRALRQINQFMSSIGGQQAEPVQVRIRHHHHVAGGVGIGVKADEAVFAADDHSCCGFSFFSIHSACDRGIDGGDQVAEDAVVVALPGGKACGNTGPFLAVGRSDVRIAPGSKEIVHRGFRLHQYRTQECAERQWRCFLVFAGGRR